MGCRIRRLAFELPNRFNPIPGVYYLYVSDDDDCSVIDTFEIQSLIPIGISFDTVPATHCDSANAQLTIHVANPGKWLYRIDTTGHWDSIGVYPRILPGLYQVFVANSDSSCVVDTLIRVPSKETCIEICEGDSLLIGRPDLNAWCMKWMPETGLASPENSQTWAKPSGNVRYILYLSDDDGNLLDSLVYKITMCPTLMVTPTQLNLCEQENPTLTVAGGQGPYLWKNENGEVIAEGETFSPTVPGAYLVTQSGETGLFRPAYVQVTKEVTDGVIGILAPMKPCARIRSC
ncbi:MAG: hypothetical protein IPI11_18600 [Haliscomenobacter sp.]|nr:hypothetical protein [Haliscomenobacter sp.]